MAAALLFFKTHLGLDTVKVLSSVEEYRMSLGIWSRSIAFGSLGTKRDFYSKVDYFLLYVNTISPNVSTNSFMANQKCQVKNFPWVFPPPLMLYFSMEKFPHYIYSRMVATILQRLAAVQNCHKDPKHSTHSSFL